MSRLTRFVAVLVVSLLSLTASAAAHVVVKPGEALTAAFQTFTIGVPNEREQATTEVKLLIPKGLQFVSPAHAPGWEVNVEKQGTGEDATVKSLTWSGGAVAVGFRQDFAFSAKTPEKPAELQWKAYQTYEDGQVVAWDLTETQQPKKADGSPDFSKSGPFSVTKVVAETEQTAARKKAEQTAADARQAASRANTTAIVSVVIGLVAVALATRKKA